MTTRDPYGIWRGALLALTAACLAAVRLAAGWPAAPAFAQAPPPEPGLPVDVTGASAVDYDAQTQQYIFTGEPVVVTRGEQRLVATEIEYNGAKRLAVLPQGGTVSTPTMELRADQITADLGNRHFQAEGRVAGRMLDQGVWTTLHAAHLVADDRPDLRRAEATGDVVAQRNDEELRADHAIYDRLTGRGTVEGHAVLTRGGDRLAADRIVADLGTDDAEATGHVTLDRTSLDTHGSGDVATYSGRSNLATLSGHAALMRQKDTVTAERITVHLDRDEVIADGHAVLVVHPEEGQGSQP